MKKLFLITSLLLALNIHSQTNNDAEHSFLFNFLNENIIVLKNKDDQKTIFNSELLNIKIDFLNQYGADIIFCKFELGKNLIKTINDKTEIEIHMSSCTEYIMAYDIESKNTYRLQGFKGNDLLFLLRDIRKHSYAMSVKKTLSELNDLNIGIDFQAIYKALQKLDFSAECLKICSDGKPAHGRLK